MTNTGRPENNKQQDNFTGVQTKLLDLTCLH